ncbi:adenine DNA glycosylase [Cinnamomum micranthum f. kanehirae]|uniref:Adenine DNA glycosylase n=1 Tax=Cinnamomum micranthum f. kanehirae TaxID=337451 RepID=A0A3S3MXK2_9MAGN|nr:adenine DNA glycosylase [Cinnamomum micranthum f. kanehirae]
MLLLLQASSFNLNFLAGKSPNLNLNFPALFPSPMEKKQEKKRARSTKGVGCKSTVEDIEDFSSQEVVKIRASLLRWYYENQRVLPWRINQDEEKEEGGEDGREARAYGVWVSEVMLQQTRVLTVIDYYNRWMEKWPTVRHLAEASQEEVNEMWAGLGYYRRARFLLEGAKSIAEGGEFPTTVSSLRKVRGIGDYTAGAIASIAFKEVVPVVDGNVIRVISRLKAISANPKESTTVKSFWKLAGQLVDPSRPGDFNQALMELGATVCTPLSPSCSACPISDQCHAMSISRNCQTVQVTDFPMKVAKTKQRHDFAAVCVIEITDCKDPEFWKAHSENTAFLLVKRPDEGLLAGLWEFPSVVLDGERVDATTRRKAMDQYLKKLFKIDIRKNGSLILREDVGEYVHIFTHIKLRMYVELLVLYLKGGVNSLYDKENENSIAWKHIDRKSIQGTGLTSGVRKVYNMIQSFKQQEPMNPTRATRKKASKH